MATTFVELTPEAREAIELLVNHASTYGSRLVPAKQLDDAIATIRALLASPKQGEDFQPGDYAKLQDWIIEQKRSNVSRHYEAYRNGQYEGLQRVLDVIRSGSFRDSASEEKTHD